MLDERRNLALRRKRFVLRVVGIALIVVGALALVLGQYLYYSFYYPHLPCALYPGVPCGEIEWPLQAGLTAFYSGVSATMIGVTLIAASHFIGRQKLVMEHAESSPTGASAPADYNTTATAVSSSLGKPLLWTAIAGAGFVILLLALDGIFTFTNCHCITSYGYDFAAELVGLAVMLVGAGGLIGTVRLETRLLLSTLGVVLTATGLLMMLAECLLGPYWNHSCLVGYPCPMPPPYSHPTTYLFGASLLLIGLGMFAVSFIFSRDGKQRKENNPPLTDVPPQRPSSQWRDESTPSKLGHRKWTKYESRIVH